MAELQEEDFIQERWKKEPTPLVVYLGVILGVALLFWSVSWWTSSQLNDLVRKQPFSQVTNRQISLFLWQFPEFMRAHRAKKSGYLPDFDYTERVGIKENKADRVATAPPEVLFRYHHWDRLLSHDVVQRPVLRADFGEFLAQVPEWHPKFWRTAPLGYQALVRELGEREDEELAVPLEVKQAYLGWKNYFREGEAMNQAVFTYGELEAFLDNHPNYARNFWRNVLKESSPRYLWDLSSGNYAVEDTVPGDQLSGALRAALWNSRQDRKP